MGFEGEGIGSRSSPSSDDIASTDDTVEGVDGEHDGVLVVDDGRPVGVNAVDKERYDDV